MFWMKWVCRAVRGAPPSAHAPCSWAVADDDSSAAPGDTRDAAAQRSAERTLTGHLLDTYWTLTGHFNSPGAVVGVAALWEEPAPSGA